MHKANVVREETDLTSGNLFKKLVLFSIPILFTSILSMLFTTADLFTVSRFGEGAISMAAVGANNSVINILICLFVGLGVGANIVVGNAKGRNDKVVAFRATQTSIVIAFLSGIVIAILGIFVSRPILELMNATSEIIDKASLYLMVYLFGAPFLLIYNFGASILRAYGESKKPLYALLFSGLFNIVLNLLFVAVFKLDVLGVAIATDIAQAAGAAAVMYFLCKDKGIFVNFTFKKLKIYRDEFLEVGRLGLSAGIGGLLFNITNVVIQASVNSFGTACISACAACSNIEGYEYFVINAISTAALSMVGQNNGAKKRENVLKTLKYAQILEVTCGLFVGSIVCLLREPLLKIFIQDSEPNFDEMMMYGTQRLMIISLSYFICGINDTFSAYYRGLKYSLLPTFFAAIGICLFRLVFLFTLFKLPFFHNIVWLYLTYPMSWILTIILELIPIKHFSNKAFAQYVFVEDMREKKAILAKYEK